MINSAGAVASQAQRPRTVHRCLPEARRSARRHQFRQAQAGPPCMPELRCGFLAAKKKDRVRCRRWRARRRHIRIVLSVDSPFAPLAAEQHEGPGQEAAAEHAIHTRMPMADTFALRFYEPRATRALLRGAATGAVLLAFPATRRLNDGLDQRRSSCRPRTALTLPAQARRAARATHVAGVELGHWPVDQASRGKDPGRGKRLSQWPGSTPATCVARAARRACAGRVSAVRAATGTRLSSPSLSRRAPRNRGALHRWPHRA